jgi:hypothetical protein
MGMIWGTPPPTVTIDTVTSDGVTGDLVITTRAVWLSALVLRVPSAGTAAAVNVRTGPPDAGTLMFAAAVSPGETFAWSPGLPGLPAPAGVGIEVTAGSVDVSVTTAEVIPT